MKDDKTVAKELFYAIKEDTVKVQNMDADTLYSKQMGDQTALVTDYTFESLGLKPNLIESLFKTGIDKPLHIQKQAIPIILSGNDCAFHSKSGTGKTIGFVLGILGRIQQGKGTQAIIITPTRELNIQVNSVISSLSNPLDITVCCALREFRSDKVTNEVVIGCPAKIINLIDNGVISKENLKMIVLDEADQMISGRAFGAQTLKLLKMLGEVQKIFFSATYAEKSKEAICLISPKCSSFFKENAKADNICLYQIEVENKKKIEVLKSLLELLTVSQTIVFVGSRREVDHIAKVFEEDNFTVARLHGEIPNEARDEVLKKFSTGQSKILVTTDVFSRGMDIPQVNLIVNYDLPQPKYGNAVEIYIHRIGRSGRFNRKGFVIDFITGTRDCEDLLDFHTKIGENSKKFTIEALMEVMTNE
ncbi:hypothetical protein NUSPORA_00944 [Nucleospora cyclopteri]